MAQFKNPIFDDGQYEKKNYDYQYKPGKSYTILEYDGPDPFPFSAFQ